MSAPVPSMILPLTSPLPFNPLPLNPLSLTPSLAVSAIPAAPQGPAIVPANAAAPLARPVEAAASIPASDETPEFQSAKSAARFDGSVPSEAEAPSVSVPVPALGSGLRMAQPDHDSWLASVGGLLAQTRTGRRVLRDIDALAASRGRPVLLDIKAIGNNGEFRYDSDILVMDVGHLKRDPYQSAPILAHELQHVLQRAQELPADALELEIESYTVESRVWSELGVEPDAGTFARSARAKLMKGPAVFAKWLGDEYKNNIPLYGSNVDAYVARLEKKLKSSKALEAKTLRKKAAVERVIATMRENGQSEESIAAYRREDLEPLERSLRDNAFSRAWLERDLLLLSTPEGRERFRAYSRGVMRRARALSR